MARKRGFVLLNFLMWLTGVLVSLAVGFAMTAGGALNMAIPYLSDVPYLVATAGWVVVISTILSAIMAIVGYFK